MKINLVFLVIIFHAFLGACSDSEFSAAPPASASGQSPNDSEASADAEAFDTKEDSAATEVPSDSSGTDAEITTNESVLTLNSPNVVIALTGSITFDGKSRFCVDFKNGKVILDEQASRLADNDVALTLKVKTNADLRTLKYHSDRGNLNLPGNWSFVKDARPRFSNFRSCTDSRRTMDPIITKTKQGELSCVDLDDSAKAQSGRACYDLDWQLEVNDD